MLCLLLLLLACQDPFGADRQDLVGFRVAALTAPASPIGGETSPRAAVIVDGKPWSDTPVSMRWHWVEPTEAAVALLTADTPAAANGASPRLVRPPLRTRLVLVAETAEGSLSKAFLDLPDNGTPLVLSEVDWAGLPWDVRTVDGEDLAIPARLQAKTHPAAGVRDAGFLRFTAVMSGEPIDHVGIRWMSTHGTWLELTPHTADWTPGTLELDNGDVERGRVGRHGGVTVLALALDASGRGDFLARDLWVGSAPEGGRVAGRWLSGVSSSGWVRATVLADDDSPTGLALSDPEPVDPDALPLNDPWGTASIPCAAGAPLDPSWLLEQRCTRVDLVGARVVVEVAP